MPDHHHHHHHHDSTKNLRIAFFLNITFAIIEVVGGLLTNSLAILSDALHDMGDSFTLAVSWYFEKISTKERTARLTYGYKRYSLVGALINSFVLLAGSSFIIYRAIPRLLHPEHVEAEGMLLIACLGISINGIAFLRLKKGHKLSERVVMLHLLEDVLGWIAVLIVSIVMLFFYLPVLDPVLSIVVTIYIMIKAFQNFFGIIHIFLQSVPSDIEIDEIERCITSLQEVSAIHDLHIWSLDGVHNILTVHVVVKKQMNLQKITRLKQKVRAVMHEQGIRHTTIEIDREGELCDMEAC